MMVGAGHSAKSDRDPSIEVLAALRTRDGFGVFAPQPFQDLFVTLTRPLILPSHLGVVNLVTQTVLLVGHTCSPLFSCLHLTIRTVCLKCRPATAPDLSGQSFTVF